MLQASELGPRFDRLADGYDRHAALEQEVGRRLLERCSYRRREPQCIVDAGCATGELSGALKRQFRKARVTGLDLSPAMLRRLRRRSAMLHRLSAVCGDVARLPLVDATVDLLVCNLALHWTGDLRLALDECCRVLQPDGMLLFATLGPGSFGELRDVWSLVDPAVRFLEFPDALQVGDAMLASGLIEPVVDTERIALDYPDFEAMMRELESTGSSLLVEDWERWPAHRHELAKLLAQSRNHVRPIVSFEIIYGTAFGPSSTRPGSRHDPDVLRIPADSLLTSRPMG